MNLANFPFPQVNASLNGTSAVLLLTGFVFIKRKNVRAHATCMIATLCTSTIFLASYITYHFVHGMTVFPKSSVKPIYLAILGTHTILAVVTVPLVIVTFKRAWRRDWIAHRRIAWWTFPIWLYVSVTGVIIYWMLYDLAPTLR